MEKVNRRPLMLTSTFGCAIFLFLLSAFYSFAESSSVLPMMCVVALLGYIFVYQLGLGPIPFFCGSGKNPLKPQTHQNLLLLLPKPPQNSSKSDHDPPPWLLEACPPGSATSWSEWPFQRFRERWVLLFSSSSPLFASFLQYSSKYICLKLAIKTQQKWQPKLLMASSLVHWSTKYLKLMPTVFKTVQFFMKKFQILTNLKKIWKDIEISDWSSVQ